MTTVESLKEQGESDLRRGLPHLDKHVAILSGFGLPVEEAIKRFPGNSDADQAMISDHCADCGVRSAVAEAFSKGGAGTAALAEQVIAVLDGAPNASITPTYSLDDTLEGTRSCRKR